VGCVRIDGRRKGYFVMIVTASVEGVGDRGEEPSFKYGSGLQERDGRKTNQRDFTDWDVPCRLPAPQARPSRGDFPGGSCAVSKASPDTAESPRLQNAAGFGSTRDFPTNGHNGHNVRSLWDC
jgi:hypothetical protein